MSTPSVVAMSVANPMSRLLRPPREAGSTERVDPGVERELVPYEVGSPGGSLNEKTIITITGSAR